MESHKVDDLPKATQLFKPGCSRGLSVCLSLRSILFSLSFPALGLLGFAWTALKCLFPSAWGLRKSRGLRRLRSHLSVPPRPDKVVYIIAWPLSCPWAASCSQGFGGGQTRAPSPASATSKSEFSWIILQKRRQRGRGTCAFSQECGQLSCHALAPCSLSPRIPSPFFSPVVWKVGVERGPRRLKG